MPVRSPGCSKGGLRGTLSPLDTLPVPEKPGAITPLSSARRTRPRRRKVNCPFGAREGALGYGAGRGEKVRQSWTFTENFMRRTAVRLSCLFCRRQNAAGDCALRARKARLACLSFSPVGSRKLSDDSCSAKSKHRLSEKRSLSTGLTGFLLFSCPHDMIVLK